ncbi:SinR family protein [Lactobacillus buchneri]|uniref:SinR family protein n=1 Tax=Lentilactobacillus buchneri TaxID=1581 RepID=UPI001290B155|nr:SinR family protein [Lentilactobacillus buchneri]MQM81537.1 SinR family protein [Lentilactobacillus buchneri]
MAYLITYDLDNPGQNYKDLIEHLKTYPGWARMTESCWSVTSGKTAKEVRNDLEPFIDNNDRLLVVRLSGEAAWTGIPKDVTDWIHNNV